MQHKAESSVGDTKDELQEPKKDRLVTIGIRVSTKEKAFFQETARSLGMTLSQYLRMVASEEAKRIIAQNDSR